MKILMQNRYDALINKGGDSYQMIYTKKYLEQNGVQVNISTELTPNLENYDIIHLFNITRVHETYVQFKNAKKKNKKVVLSPIYHSINDIRNYERKNLTGLHGFIVKLFKDTNKIQLIKTLYYTYKYPSTWYSWITQVRKGYTGQQKELLKNADYILPNSELEMKSIKEELFNSENVKLKYDIVYNGIENIIYEESTRILDWLKINEIKDFVLCSGRIEPRKNQLTVIQALKNDEIKIVFAGALNKMHHSYSKEFLKQVRQNRNLFYIGEVKRDEIMTLNKYAKVSVLASWFETTGLVGLESGITGCNVVVTEKGYAREYYREYAWYCNPESLPSIRDSVISAYNAPRGSKQLEEHIQQMGLTWEQAAKKTAEIYKKILQS